MSEEDKKDYYLSGFSMKGPDIAGKEKVNQDNFSIVEIGDCLLLAVSDGLGSKPRSHEGSKLVTDFLEEEWRVLLTLDDDTLEEQISILIDSASSLLQEKDPNKEMSCTLTISIIDRKNNEWATGTVGDSFCVLREEGSKEYLLFSGSELSRKEKNVTETISEINLNKEIHSGKDKLAFLAVTSDGLDFASVHKGLPEEKFWKIVEREVRTEDDIREFFDYLESKEKIIDDTTLALYVNKVEE